MLSVIRYASLILVSSSNKCLSKLQVLLMKCAGPLLGFKSFKFSTQKIMSELKQLSIYQLVTKESVLFIHKIIYENQPKSISNLITFSLSNSKNHRSAHKSIMVEDHNSKRTQKSVIYMSNHLYNYLPSDIKNKNPKSLSKYLQSNIKDYYPFDRIQKYDPG